MYHSFFSIGITSLIIRSAYSFLGHPKHALSADAKSSILRGGYDATVGADPSTPIQFFTTPENTCPYAARYVQ